MCFLFFDADKLPYCDSRMQRDFRTAIFSRWNALNGGKSVHDANKLEPREFNRETVNYFARALVVDDKFTKRTETNWWGVFNKQPILNRSTVPTRQEKKAVFDAFFKKPSLKLHRAAEQRVKLPNQNKMQGLSRVTPDDEQPL